MKNFNIAIDGPSGAGKSTISRKVAAELGYIYVDTGALYRAVALAFLNHTALEEIDIDLKYINGEQRVFLNGEDVSAAIRQHEVSQAASDYSKLLEVREFLLERQRKIARENSVIMDGRDIGTIILPNAQVKIFLTAKPEKRAKRRYDELIAKGQTVDYETVLQDVIARDKQDTEREIAPLKPAENSIIIDTTDLTFDESVELIKSTILSGNL